MNQAPVVLRVWLVAAIAVGLALPSLAQPEISEQAYTSSNLSGSERDEIAAYISHYVDDLKSADSSRVIAAREALIEIYNEADVRTASDAFRSTYGELLSQGLNNAIGEAQLIGKMNALIVANRLVDPGVVQLVSTGLADDNDAVRYLAAKAVFEIATHPDRPGFDQLSANDFRGMLNSLNGAIAGEDSGHVLRMLSLAIGSLPIPEAADALLDALNDRITVHLQNPGRSMSGERAAIENLYKTMVQLPPDQVEDQFKRAMAVGLKFMTLSARQLQEGGLNAGHRAERDDMISYVETWMLTWGAVEIFDDAPSRLPQSTRAARNNEEWVVVENRIEEWRRLLTGPPYLLNDGDLLVGGQ